ncbi:MAG TPA: hypothetical protein VGI85_07820, partial [Chthoniobacterales bacterium]
SIDSACPVICVRFENAAGHQQSPQRRSRSLGDSNRRSNHGRGAGGRLYQAQHQGQGEARGLKLAVSRTDLMTLEGKDTPSKVAFFCRKAMQPADPRYDVPACAAVCVYPKSGPRRETVSRRFKSQAASVATAFRTGLMPPKLKLAEVRSAAGDGADEIDMVIDRGVF